MFERKVLLDTCAVLWLASGDNALSKKARSVIENAALVYVSAISAWEISLKEQQGSLTLPVKAEIWFERVLEQHNLTVASLDVDILIAANRLPSHHRDPTDRFIIATAMRENAPIVTGDKRFDLYEVRIVR